VSTHAVAFESVTVSRLRREIVRDASFAVHSGAVHALLGHNGAGKTTLLRAMCGVVATSRGRVVQADEPAVLFAHSRLPRETTAAQVLEYRRRVRGRSRADVAAVAERTGVAGFLDRPSAALSTGMAQRVGIAAALVDDAATLVLDEPTTGLDPQGVAGLLGLVVGLRTEGRTVMICSHDLSQLELVCDEVTCLRDGRVTVTGPVDAVAATVAPAGHVLRTADDTRARTLLAAAGFASTATPRGLRVGPEVGLTDALLVLRGLDVRESTVERGLFARVYDRYASAPQTTPGRRARRGRRR
jgi:ABC-type multidrug transport system ATPase subunit